ncbi:pyridine nucleotide-disulfide oxidoreductase [Salmonella enterica subsp. enterica]|nr:pyridine nucleotide-disulfide oxidoreductase [Salmonella enterica subsp. enterica]
MTQYQALIIGFGKAGKTLAATLAKTGWRVAIIEQSASMFGGNLHQHWLYSNENAGA